MTSANTLTNRRLIQASKEKRILFRNHRGKAWQGKSRYVKDKNTVFIENPRFCEFGLFPGAGDLIGWQQVTITPEMVGQTVAIFVSEEIKSVNDKMSKEQERWKDIVIKNGGIAVTVKEEKNGNVEII